MSTLFNHIEHLLRTFTLQWSTIPFNHFVAFLFVYIFFIHTRKNEEKRRKKCCTNKNICAHKEKLMDGGGGRNSLNFDCLKKAKKKSQNKWIPHHKNKREKGKGGGVSIRLDDNKKRKVKHRLKRKRFFFSFFLFMFLPTLKCPSCSAIDPRLTFSIIAPLRDDDGNVMPPIIFKPKISSPSIFFLNIIWPIMRWPSADTCQLTGFYTHTTTFTTVVIQIYIFLSIFFCVVEKFFFHVRTHETDDIKFFCFVHRRKKSISRHNFFLRRTHTHNMMCLIEFYILFLWKLMRYEKKKKKEKSF